MVGDRLGVLQQALVFEVGGDAGRAEGMVAGVGAETGHQHLALDHPVGVLLIHPPGQAGLAAGRAEQKAVRVVGDAGGGDILVEIFFQRVMAGHLVLLAALFMQPDPAARHCGVQLVAGFPGL